MDKPKRGHTPAHNIFSKRYKKSRDSRLLSDVTRGIKRKLPSGSDIVGKTLQEIRTDGGGSLLPWIKNGSENHIGPSSCFPFESGSPEEGPLNLGLVPFV